MDVVQRAAKKVRPITAWEMRGKVLPTRAEFKSDRANLAKALTKRPYELFPASEGYDRSTTSQIRKQFPEFKVAVVGLAGAGKSTTLRWLLYYAGAARKWRRQVTVGVRPHYVIPQTSKKNGLTATLNAVQLQR